VLHLLTPMEAKWRHLLGDHHLDACFLASMREKSPRNVESVANQKLDIYHISARKKPGTHGWVHIALAKKPKEAFFKRYVFTYKCSKGVTLFP
jgi:hypothetical protein